MLSDPLLRSTDDIAPVWVLDDPRSGTASQAIGIAERLGVPHLRVPLNWNWLAHVAALSSAGSLKGLSGGPGWPFTAPRGPAMTLSAGSRSEAVALWMRSRFGARIVHCMKPKYGHASRFDLLVIPQHDKPKNRPNVLPVLGTPHRLSPLALSQARVAWAGRLSHLPRPLVTLLVGGSNGEAEMRPSFAHALGRQAAQLAQAAGGAVLATTSRRTGVEATAALAAGLASAMHLLYRWGEPGENPYEGYLGLADAIIVTGDSVSMISEACGADAPVFIAGSDSPGRLRALHASLYETHQAKPLGNTLASWPRTPLDEAGRVASALQSPMARGPQAVD